MYERVFGDEEKLNKFLRWRVQVLERGVKMLHFKPGGVNSIIQVTDLKDMPKRELRVASNQIISLFQDNYSEMVAIRCLKCSAGDNSKERRNIFPAGDTSKFIPSKDADISIIEEPEHVNWYHHGKRWTDKLNHVVGIVHTNYLEYIKREKHGAVQAFFVNHVNNLVTRAYCDKVQSVHKPEALATGKFVVSADRPSNEFFRSFLNCLTYKTSEDFVNKTKESVSKEPLPHTHEYSYLDKIINDGDGGRRRVRKSRSVPSFNEVIDGELAFTHYVLTGNDFLRQCRGATPRTKDYDKQHCKDLNLVPPHVHKLIFGW